MEPVGQLLVTGMFLIKKIPAEAGKIITSYILQSYPKLYLGNDAPTTLGHTQIYSSTLYLSLP